MKKILKWTAIIVLLIVVGAFIFVLVQTHERNKDYSLNLNLPKQNSVSGQLKVGFAIEKITPELPDSWTDADSNAKYEPEKGDTYVDGNKNGMFDAFWMAGFDNKRAANGIHDDLWARAVVFDDSASVVGMVVIDAIGFFHDDVIAVRKLVAEKNPKIDHVILSSTHTHEAPDLQGLWGESEYKSGVNQEYRKMVQQKAADAICKAYQNRVAATLEYAQIDSIEKDLIDDFRMPRVFDEGIRLIRVKNSLNGKLMGVLVNIGDHPETAGSKNLLITSDIFHYLRDGVEQGIFYENEKKRDGAGGTVIVMNGAVGGLMSSMGSATHDKWLNKTFTTDENNFDKVRAQGYRFADQILTKLDSGQWKSIENPDLKLKAKTFYFRLDNSLFKLGAILAVFDRGFKNLKYVKSEIDLLTIGPAWFLTIPGEINPELLDGGIETPEGADYKTAPVEVPPIRQMMKGDINFVVGLANDEVGYMMPKSHWDEEAPYTYGEKEAPYGEINSLGPETGPEIHKQANTIIEEMKRMFNQ
ncbi:MAG: hypothetical protein U0W24_02145 [Bacteroidales bacterium]